MASAGGAPTQTRGDETKHKIAAAAAEVFAEVGLKGASVRQICERAGANIAAVNYHFHGKEELYRAVVSALMAEVFVLPGLAEAGDRARSWQERVSYFVSAFVLATIGNDKGGALAKILAWEMASPTGLLDDILPKGVMPHLEILSDILRQAAPRARPYDIHIAAFGIMGLVTTFHRGDRFWRHVEPDVPLDLRIEKDVSRILTTLVVGAIEEFQGRDG